jgi:hypothetical protein
MHPLFDEAINPGAECFQRLVMNIGPVLRQQVIIEYIDQHTRIAPAHWRNTCTALSEGRMRFCVAVDGAMQGHAARQIVRQPCGQRTLDPVPGDATDDQCRIITCEQGMGKEVQNHLQYREFILAWCFMPLEEIPQRPGCIKRSARRIKT